MAQSAAVRAPILRLRSARLPRCCRNEEWSGRPALMPWARLLPAVGTPVLAPGVARRGRGRRSRWGDRSRIIAGGIQRGSVVAGTCCSLVHEFLFGLQPMGQILPFNLAGRFPYSAGAIGDRVVGGNILGAIHNAPIVRVSPHPVPHFARIFAADFGPRPRRPARSDAGTSRGH